MHPYGRRFSGAIAAVALVGLLALGGSSGNAQDATQAATSIDITGATTITLAEEIAIDGDGATQDGTDIVITEGGSYVVQGTLADGMIHVAAPGASVDLVLAGATISNSDGPAIYLESAAEATVSLMDGTNNAISDGGAAEQDAALYGNVSFTIRGGGALDVQAVDEGISSTEHIFIESGAIRIHAYEDGINANQDGVSQIDISGGFVFVATEVGDGIDSNGSITITGGTVITQGALVDANSGLDADGPVTIDGGMVLSTGVMMQAPSQASAQGIILATFGGTQSAGTLVVVRSGDTELVAFAPSIPFNAIYFSSADVVPGVAYDVYLGGTAQGEAVDGLYVDGSANPGTLVATVTTESSQQGGFGPPR
ncbi:MAG: carbohydrate-binding domain-containing protein [Thermomicrobiales bacterium]